MRRIAIIKNGIVENVALWEADTDWKDATEDEGNMLVDVTNDLSVGPDFTYSNGKFTPPPYTPKEEEGEI